MQREKPEVGKVLRTALVPEMRSINEKARTIQFVASDETTDRYGDVLKTGGWELANYKKNPLFLFSHKSNEPPIGKCVEIHIESNPAALVQTIEFAPKETYEFADTIFRLYAEGYMRAVSVGFIPTKQPDPITDLEGHFTGYQFNGQELLELSACQIPANPNAIARMVSKGFSEADLERVFSGEASTAKSREEIYKELAELNAEIASIAVDVALKTTRHAVAVLKAHAVKSGEAIQDSGIVTIEQLVSAVREAGDSIRGSEECTELL